MNDIYPKKEIRLARRKEIEKAISEEIKNIINKSRDQINSTITTILLLKRELVVLDILDKLDDAIDEVYRIRLLNDITDDHMDETMPLSEVPILDD